MKFWDRVRNTPFFIRLFNWEYWPTICFYWPMLIYAPVLALRSRTTTFFSAANPGIYLSGFGLESKYDTIQKVPAAHRPKSLRLPPRAAWAEVERALRNTGIDFPLIAKPDVGFRGLLVQKIVSPQELRAYLEQYPFPFLLQEFLTQPAEVGVLYYRLPEWDRGKITSLTLKEFLSVEGDGRSTVEELIERKPRAHLQLERLRRLQPEILSTIPEAGRRVPLGVVGNHSKGTLFINGNDRIDEDLIAVFERVSRQIDGFYYGRFDIKCDSLESLKTGGPFKIIELNGICSEPTHIYDPGRISYFGALREVLRHWAIVRRVSLANHRRGVPYEKPGKVIQAFRGLFAYQKKIVEIDSL